MFQTNFVEKIKTHFMLKNFFFENPTVYEIMWKNILVPDRPQMTMWRVRISCSIPKAAHGRNLRVLLRVVVDSDFVINIFVLIFHLA